MISGQNSFNFPTSPPTITEGGSKVPPPLVLFEVDPVQKSVPPPRVKRKIKKIVHAEKEKWIPSSNFYLHDYEDEIAIARHRALVAEPIGGPMSDIAGYLAATDHIPPLSGLVPIARAVCCLARKSTKRFAVVACNSPALIAVCQSALPGAVGDVSYADKETARLGKMLNGVVNEVSSIKLANEKYGFLLRPLPVEGEKMSDFRDFLAMTAIGGYAIAFVKALSFMDVQTHSLSESPESLRSSIHTDFNLLSSIRYASDPHTHKSHVDLLVFHRRICPTKAQCLYEKTGNGFLPWQKANEHYIKQPGLIFDSRSLFSDAVARAI